LAARQGRRTRRAMDTQGLDTLSDMTSGLVADIEVISPGG
jgi:hypothetical protein